jgi:hypothetical protein
LKGQTGPKEGERTFAVAHVLDRQCQLAFKVHGAYMGKQHAERLVLDQLEPGKELGKKLQQGFTVFWMIDQVPCTDGDKLPKEGYCTVNLKGFAKSRNVGQRVFVAADESEAKGIMKSPKSFAKRGTAPSKEQYMELTELTVKAK